MKKSLPEDAITNELTGGSAFFRRTEADTNSQTLPVSYPSPQASPALNRASQTSPSVAIPPSEEKDRLLDSQISNNLTSQNDRLLDKEISNNLASENVRLLDFIRFFLQQKNETPAGFRYPQPLVDQLDQLEFDLKRKFGKRVPRTTVVVAAVAHLIWDYNHNGQDSLLVQIVNQADQ